MPEFADLSIGVDYLRKRTEEMRESGLAAAVADAEYRKVKAEAILEERQGGTPATICREVIYARQDVGDALLQRNCTQALYEADRESINSIKMKLRILDAQLARDWQAAGAKGY